MSKPLIFVETYGCQQNEADSEKILGTAISKGYEKAERKQDADLIIINTCAIREHAELRALSGAGQLKHLKQAKPSLLIGMCGCMVQQEHRMEDIKKRYPYVDFVFGTNKLSSFADILDEVKASEKRGFFVESYQENPGDICEGMPVCRSSSSKAYVSVMYGCNNFCSYCVVPYVRGRERSRKCADVINEVKTLTENGYREITLLGQNVNSYGKDTGEGVNFSELIRRLCALDGDFVLKFMTSHPKDASHELIDVIADNPKCAKQFHLPLQSGSNSILKAMNRKYTREKYLETVEYMRYRIPDIVLTSDIIVGFPGETDRDFEDTLDIMRTVGFDNVYSFIYSMRRGTPAAQMTNQISDEIKKERMSRLLELQCEISTQKNQALVSKVLKGVIEGESKSNPKKWSAHSTSGKLIHFDRPENPDEYLGKFADIRITEAKAIMLYGEIEKIYN